MAKQLQIHVNTVYRYLRQGRLTGYKIGNWRITEENLDKFITEVKASPIATRDQQERL